MSYDVAALRARFPALAAGYAHFDGPGGSQVPVEVAQAVAATLTAPIANRGRVTPAERFSDDVVLAARQAVADLLGADPRGVVFGRSMTSLTVDLAHTLAQGWGPGDEVVVTRLDHDANVRPWVLAAQRAGATVRWVDFDPATTELGVDDVAAVLSGRTRVVAVTGASNLVGTRPPIAEIVARVHGAGGERSDGGRGGGERSDGGVAGCGHCVWWTGCTSPPTPPWTWPRSARTSTSARPTSSSVPTAACSPPTPRSWRPCTPTSSCPPPTRSRSASSSARCPTSCSRARRRRSTSWRRCWTRIPTQRADQGSRRDRLVAGMAAVEAHEDRLRARIETGLAWMAGVEVLSRAAHRTPTLLVRVPGGDRRAHAGLAERGVFAPAGSFYAIEASRRLGLGDDGALRIGLAPYNDDEDVDRLLDGLAALAVR